MHKRGEEKEGIKVAFILVFAIFFIFAILLISSVASAGWSDWIKKTITGRLAQQPTNVSIALVGASTIGITVWNSTLIGTYVDPTESSVINISFNVTITDSDGLADINTSSVKATFNRTGEYIRTNSTCALRSTANTTLSYNFTCTIEMWYWDEPGQWTINVTANDLGNTSWISNYTPIFTYGQLQAIVISPDQLTWASVVPGNINQTSNNDPTEINNTGNYAVTAENIQIMGRQLHGATTNTEYIAASNFTVFPVTGGTPDAECNMSNTVLTNGTWVGIVTANLSAGNLTYSESNATESIYYCLREVPGNISSQTYSTTFAGSWTIKII